MISEKYSEIHAYVYFCTAFVFRRQNGIQIVSSILGEMTRETLLSTRFQSLLRLRLLDLPDLVLTDIEEPVETDRLRAPRAGGESDFVPRSCLPRTSPPPLAPSREGGILWSAE